jgi:hypothetical protein
MQKADRGNNEHAILKFDVGRSALATAEPVNGGGGLGVRRFSAKLIIIEHTEATAAS